MMAYHSHSHSHVPSWHHSSTTTTPSPRKRRLSSSSSDTPTDNEPTPGKRRRLSRLPLPHRAQPTPNARSGSETPSTAPSSPGVPGRPWIVPQAQATTGPGLGSAADDMGMGELEEGMDVVDLDVDFDVDASTSTSSATTPPTIMSGVLRPSSITEPSSFDVDVDADTDDSEETQTHSSSTTFHLNPSLAAYLRRTNPLRSSHSSHSHDPITSTSSQPYGVHERGLVLYRPMREWTGGEPEVEVEELDEEVGGDKEKGMGGEVQVEEVEDASMDLD